MTQLLVHKDQAYRFSEIHSGFSGWVPVPSFKGDPNISWSGKRMPFTLWQQMLAFFKQSYDTTKSETQVRFFRNPDTGEWRIWAFPQRYGTGMTAHDLPDDPMFAGQMEAIREGGFEYFGSGHHHCIAGAFQSSTDKSDETQTGLHITIGKLDQETFDLDARVSVMVPGEIAPDGVTVVRAAAHQYYKADMQEWVEIPEALVPSTLPQKIRDEAYKYYLTAPAPADVSFPGQWMANLVKYVPTNTVGYTGPAGGTQPATMPHHMTAPRVYQLPESSIQKQQTPPASKTAQQGELAFSDRVRNILASEGTLDADQLEEVWAEIEEERATLGAAEKIAWLIVKNKFSFAKAVRIMAIDEPLESDEEWEFYREVGEEMHKYGVFWDDIEIKISNFLDEWEQESFDSMPSAISEA